MAVIYELSLVIFTFSTMNFTELHCLTYSSSPGNPTHQNQLTSRSLSWFSVVI